MATGFIHLVVVIPTRNRCDIAMRAAQSVLAADARHRVSVLLSDNSTEDAHRQSLLAFAAARSDVRLRVVSPPSPLPMADHWEWALDQALLTDASHICVLTDRMTFRDASVERLVSLAEHYPGDVISFTYDRVDDVAKPVRYTRLPRSGAVYRIRTDELLRQASSMTFRSCLPRLLNCVVPATTMRSLKTSFGTMVVSLAPDFCFCFRVLGSLESILYLDSSEMINSAIDRSNGASFSRGVVNAASVDFLAHAGRDGASPRSPIPGISSVGNTITHEYLSAKAEAANGRFPELDVDAYEALLAREVGAFAPGAAKDAALAQLPRRFVAKGMTLSGRIASLVQSSLISALSRNFETSEDAVSYAVGEKSRHWPALRLYALKKGWGRPVA